MEINFLNLVACFIIYSFAGWLLESVYKTILQRKLVNSGFLNGPFCPIYGIGALIMILVLGEFKNNIILLFIMAFIILSIWEYIVGFLLEKIFKTKYWDYSRLKFNINGRVCLKNSIYWGILGVLFIDFINPFINKELSLIDNKIIFYACLIIGICMLIDCIISIISIVQIDNALKYIEELNEQIRDKLEEVKIITKTIDKSKGSIQSIIDKLNKKREKFIKKLYKRIYRLKRAFPTMKSEKITELLNNKLELKNIFKKNKKIVKNSKKDLK